MILRGSGLRTIVGRRPDLPFLDESQRAARRGPPREGRSSSTATSRPRSSHAAKAARTAGVPVIMDAGNEKKGMDELIPHTDVLIASRAFGRDVGGSEDPAAAARKLFSMGPGTRRRGDRRQRTGRGSRRRRGSSTSRRFRSTLSIRPAPETRSTALTRTRCRGSGRCGRARALPRRSRPSSARKSAAARGCRRSPRSNPFSPAGRDCTRRAARSHGAVIAEKRPI